MEGGLLGAPYVAASSSSSSGEGLSSSAAATSATTKTTTSSSKGYITVTAAGSKPSPSQPPAAKPRSPQFGHITVDGELTKAKVQQLVKLLDVLPGTQHLHTLVLSNVPIDDSMPYDQLYWDKHVRFSKGLLAPQGTFAAALTTPQPSSSSSSVPSKAHVGTTPSAHGGAGSSSSSSWRSSCRVLLAGRHKTKIHISDLSPLLEATQQLEAAVLQGMWVRDMPLHLASLRPLRALQLSNVSGLSCPGVLLGVSRLTNLRHLGICNCMHSPFDFTYLPDAFSALVRLTSLDLSYTYITGEGLKGACGISSLRSLNLSFTYFCAFLPDSIRQLTGLEELDMWYTAVHQLPEGLTALTGLRSLKWGSCTEGGGVHVEDLWQLTSLCYLQLFDDTLPFLPGAVSQLTALTWLWVNSTLLQHLPDSISALVGLERLTLFTESLQALPESITMLTQLTSIKLGHCKVDKVLEGAPAAVKAFVEERKAPLW
jgi:Leucine-rich repeat (LRR) protein